MQSRLRHISLPHTAMSTSFQHWTRGFQCWDLVLGIKSVQLYQNHLLVELPLLSEKQKRYFLKAFHVFTLIARALLKVLRGGMSKQGSEKFSSLCMSSSEPSANDSGASIEDSATVSGNTAEDSPFVSGEITEASDAAEDCKSCSIGVVMFDVDFDSFATTAVLVVS